MATAEQQEFLRSLEEEKSAPARAAAARQGRFMQAAGGGLTVTVARAVTQNNPVNAGPINFTVTFNKPPTSFTNANISFVGSTVGGTLAAAVTGTGPYNVAVSGMTGNGIVQISVPAAAVTDVTGKPFPASNVSTVMFNTTAPSVTINQAAGQFEPTSASPINFTAVFNSPVTGFAGTDISFTGSTVGGTLAAAVTGGPSTYNVAVSGMTTAGNVVASIPAAAVTDMAGNPNLASTSTDNTVAFDSTIPVTRIVTATGNITVPLQNAIAASANGEIIQITAGTCSLDPIAINDKNITIRGAGQGVTNITATGGLGTWATNGAASPTWRLSGISFSGSGTSTFPLTIYADQDASWRGPFRIDHVDFNYPNGGANVQIFGPIYGLIDHCNFYGAFESTILTGLNLTSSIEDGSTIATLKGAFAASLAYQPGSSQNLCIEDCTFTGSAPNGIAAIDTGYTGARIIFRHNACSNATLYSHWTADRNVNSLWWEIYNNTFDWTAGGSLYPFRLQGGGTGLIYNNTITGFSSNYIVIGEQRLPVYARSGPPLLFVDGTHNWDGNAGDASAPGWPGLCQTGRNAGKTLAQIQAGNKQASFPLYLWNNGPQAKCANSAAAGAICDNSTSVSVLDPPYFKSTAHSTAGFGNGDVDFSITASQPAGAGTHTLVYTPLVYPHPLAT